METGVPGVHYQIAVSAAEVVLNLMKDFAAIQHRLPEEQIALDKAQKVYLVMCSNAQLVN
jgi:hypothetical protein